MSREPQAPDRRRTPRAAALAIVCGAALGLAWALVSPWLVGLEAEGAGSLRAWLFAAGLVTGVVAFALAASGGGPVSTLRGGLSLAGIGSLGAALVALALARRLDGAPATALGLCGAGEAIALGLLQTLVASAARPAVADDHLPGAPLRVLVAGACGALALAAWALASGHLVGQRVTDAERHALYEARDLVAIAAQRLQSAAGDPGALDALASRLAPPGGYLVAVDDQGRVEGGVGVGVAPGAELTAGASRCVVGRRALPCAVRRLSDASRLVAAVPPAPVGGAVVLVFALAGLAAAAVAVAIGALVGASPARELDRVSGRLDELARGPRGLEHAIVVGSLDEVGDLAAALNRLRAHLAPALTEYRVALEKAQAADQARTEFLSLVSAELRSPLEQLIAATEALLDPNAEPLTPDQADDVRTVLSAARHLSELIDEVLDISAIASGQVNLRLSELDLGQLASDVAKTQRPQLSRKGVELRVDVESPSPSVYGDERRLRQVLTNLITNAVKFTDRGSIEVRVRRAGARVEVSVRDTGPGIAPDALPRLFHEFVQLGSLKQRAHGTGLGLAICKRLVEAHGGEVSAESKVGEGSTFRVAVPAGGPRAEEAA